MFLLPQIIFCIFATNEDFWEFILLCIVRNICHLHLPSSGILQLILLLPSGILEILQYFFLKGNSVNHFDYSTEIVENSTDK